MVLFCHKILNHFVTNLILMYFYFPLYKIKCMKFENYTECLFCDEVSKIAWQLNMKMIILRGFIF